MSTVKIDSEDDELLEKLRAKMILRGVKKTKKDIISELIKRAYKSEELIAEDRLDLTIPINEDPIWKILQSPDSTGIEDTSTNIDEFIY